MSNTTTINPSNDSKDGKKNLAAKAATIATGVATGVAGVKMASNLNSVDDDIADVIETPEEISQDQPEASTEAVPSANQTSSQPSANTNAETVVEEPTPSHNSNETNTPTNQPVNPDEIAEAIISEDQVDPNDIDLENVINFDEIGTVYTVDGESHTAAVFHDNEGNQLMMVDVDGDDVFDLVYDGSGEAIAEVPGTLTVDDAQMGIADNGTYLAHNGTDNTSDFGSDSIEHDLIS